MDIEEQIAALADEMDDVDVEVAQHIAMLAEGNKVDMNEATDGPLPTEEEIDEHTLELARRVSTNPETRLVAPGVEPAPAAPSTTDAVNAQAEPSADANLAAQMAECKELSRKLAVCHAQEEERLREQPPPLWVDHRRLTMALFHPMSARQLEELNFSGMPDFPELLLPADFWAGLEPKLVANKKWAYALAALLAHICAASGGEGIKIPSAAQLHSGMRWAAPPDSYYPHGALVGMGPTFMAQIPLLQHLATRCDSGKVGPATTKQGLAAIVVSWSASLEKAKVEVRETSPLSQHPSPNAHALAHPSPSN